VDTEAKQSVNGCNCASFGDHDILEGDHNHSLKGRGKALEQKCCFPAVLCTPPTGDRLVVAVGLTGSEDPADSVFRNLKGRSLPRVPQSGPQNPAMRVLKSPRTPFTACVRRALWR